MRTDLVDLFDIFYFDDTYSLKKYPAFNYDKLVCHIMNHDRRSMKTLLLQQWSSTSGLSIGIKVCPFVGAPTSSGPLRDVHSIKDQQPNKHPIIHALHSLIENPPTAKRGQTKREGEGGSIRKALLYGPDSGEDLQLSTCGSEGPSCIPCS